MFRPGKVHLLEIVITLLKPGRRWGVLGYLMKVVMENSLVEKSFPQTGRAI